jgi:hypothetical protein
LFLAKRTLVLDALLVEDEDEDEDESPFVAMLRVEDAWGGGD